MKKKDTEGGTSLNLNTRLQSMQSMQSMQSSQSKQAAQHAVSLMQSKENPMPNPAATKEESTATTTHNSAGANPARLLTRCQTCAVTLPPSYPRAPASIGGPRGPGFPGYRAWNLSTACNPSTSSVGSQLGWS